MTIPFFPHFLKFSLKLIILLLKPSCFMLKVLKNLVTQLFLTLFHSSLLFHQFPDQPSPTDPQHVLFASKLSQNASRQLPHVSPHRWAQQDDPFH
jgi:hypothetical protein